MTSHNTYFGPCPAISSKARFYPLLIRSVNSYIHMLFFHSSFDSHELYASVLHSSLYPLYSFFTNFFLQFSRKTTSIRLSSSAVPHLSFRSVIVDFKTHSYTQTHKPDLIQFFNCFKMIKCPVLSLSYLSMDLVPHLTSSQTLEHFTFHLLLERNHHNLVFIFHIHSELSFMQCNMNEKYSLICFSFQINLFYKQQNSIKTKS